MEANRVLTELIESLKSIRNASLIAQVKEIVDEMIASETYELSSDQKSLLDTRIEKYKSGEATTYSLEEVRRKFQAKMEA